STSYHADSSANRIFHHSQTSVSYPSLRLPPLCRLVPRPHQHRLRRPYYEPCPRHQRPTIRAPCRNLFHWLLSLRNSQQSAVAQVRRAHLADAHHHHLGTARRPHRLGPKYYPALHPSLSPRPRRSRILPRNRPLSHLLVPPARTSASHRTLS